MTPRELEFLQKQLSSSRRYLEFGAGNSTKMAAATPELILIDCVESSRDFLDKNVLHFPAVAAARDAGRLHIHWIDIGPTGDWGYPINADKRHLWPNYSSQVFREKRNWDLILIDGRFRVACCLNAFLHGPDEARILIHDFSIRPKYDVVLSFMDIVERVDTFVLLRKKPGADVSQLKRLLKKYPYWPRDEPPPLKARLKSWARRLLRSQQK